MLLEDEDLACFKDILREDDQVDKFFPLLQGVKVLADKEVDEGVLELSEDTEDLWMMGLGL